MNISFLLENKTEAFYNKLLSLNHEDKYTYLTDRNLYGLKPKIDNGQISSAVEFNVKRSKGAKFQSFEIQQRKGFKIALFKL